MCLAIPGKIIEINGKKVKVQYPFEERYAMQSGVPIEIGDYVMVQMGIIIQKISKEDAQVSIDAWKASTT